jgi:hypothetical protein
MLELLAGIEAVRRVTSEHVATGPTGQRPPRTRRRRAAAARRLVSTAIVALGSPASRAHPQSGADATGNRPRSYGPARPRAQRPAA